MTKMTKYSEQIDRIKNKLREARNADKNFKVFGATGHKYHLYSPATDVKVLEFEKKYAIQLPACYKAFITQVGNGGDGYEDSAAGPFYGIYPLGKNVDNLIFDDTEKYLKNDCIIYPEMTTEFWESLRKNTTDKISNEDYKKEQGKIYAGVLPIGSQGCTYLHGIVLNGQYMGRVVNLDTDNQKPYFAFEYNFLDWYERWIDEVIDGTLSQEGPNWFGYGMGGNSTELLKKYQTESSVENKKKIAIAILQKAHIGHGLYEFIEIEYLKDKRNYTLLQILTKFNYAKSKRYILDLSNLNFEKFLQTIFLYAISQSSDWVEIISRNIHKIDTFDNYLYVRKILEKTDADFGKIIIPLLSSNSEDIRSSVINTLGNLKNKNSYLNSFIIGLEDRSKQVVLSSLNMLYDIKDSTLLPYYQKIIRGLPENKNQFEEHIEISIVKHLKLFNLTKNDLLNLYLETSQDNKL